MSSFSLLDGFIRFCGCDKCQNVCPSIIDSFKNWQLWDDNTLRWFKPLKDEHILFCCTLMVSNTYPYDEHASITNKGRLYRKDGNGKHISSVSLTEDEIIFHNSYLEILKLFLYHGINSIGYPETYHKKEYEKLIIISQDNNFSTDEITHLKEFFNYQGFLKSPNRRSTDININKLREFIEIYKKYYKDKSTKPKIIKKSHILSSFDGEKTMENIVKKLEKELKENIIKNKELEDKNKELEDKNKELEDKILKEDKSKKEEDADLCNICMTNKKEIAFIPCGHKCICIKCYEELENDKCIMCRTGFCIGYKIYE